MSTLKLMLDLRRIAPRGGSQADAFEELCCALARRECPGRGTFHRIRGEGGDGGVECLWADPQEVLHGWQVKYIFDLGKALTKAASSLAEALRRHPNLRHYIVCLPFVLSGSKGRGKGNSQLEKFEAFRAEQEQTRARSGVPLKVELWDASAIADRLLAQDHSGGLRRYWFDADPLSTSWFERNLSSTVVRAGPRYRPELHHGHALDVVFSSLGRTEAWTKLRSRWCERVAGWPLERLHAVSDHAASLVATLSGARKDLVVGLGSENHEQSVAVEGIVTASLAAARRLALIFADDLEERFGKGVSESAHFRQWHAEYMVHFPAQPLDDCRKLVAELEELQRWLHDSGQLAAREGVLVVTGPAGIGKTHGLCDAARRRLALDQAQKNRKRPAATRNHLKSPAYRPVAKRNQYATRSSSGEANYTRTSPRREAKDRTTAETSGRWHAAARRGARVHR